MSAQQALRAALVETLRGDAALTALIGPGRVHDGAPRATPAPYVDLGPMETRLLTGDPAEGERHTLDLTVISRTPARGETTAAVAAMRDALDGLGAHLGGHRLVHVSDPVMRSERLRSGRGWRGRLRVTIVTEPAN